MRKNQDVVTQLLYVKFAISRFVSLCQSNDYAFHKRPPDCSGKCAVEFVDKSPAIERFKSEITVCQSENEREFCARVVGRRIWPR